jgi:hypothetical protein
VPALRWNEQRLENGAVACTAHRFAGLRVENLHGVASEQGVVLLHFRLREVVGSARERGVTETSAPLPNVLVIFFDDLADGDLSCYGERSKLHISMHAMLRVPGSRIDSRHAVSVVEIEIPPILTPLLFGYHCYTQDAFRVRSTQERNSPR